MFQSQAARFNPLFYPILPPQSHPPSYFIMPDQFYPPSHPILRSASYYPLPATMGMNEHHVPSVQEEILGGNATSSVTPPEGGHVGDGCVVPAQAHATDMLTLDLHVAPEAPAPAESEPEPQPASSLPPETVGVEKPLSSRPPGPKALMWGEIMDTVELIPSRPPTPTSLPWGELMEEMGHQKDERQVDDILEVKEKVEEKKKGAVVRELRVVPQSHRHALTGNEKLFRNKLLS